MLLLVPGQLLRHSLALGTQILIPYWIAFHIAIAYNVDIDKNSSFPNTCSVPRALILCPNPFLSWVINLANRRPLRGNFWSSIGWSWDSLRACPLIFSGKQSEPRKKLLVSGKATPLTSVSSFVCRHDIPWIDYFLAVLMGEGGWVSPLT